MVFGLGVDAKKTFVSLLDQSDPGNAHVNAGFVATGLDYYLLVADAWTKAQTYDAVAVYLFLGNDLDDMERRYYFCQDDSLLSYDKDFLDSNCETPESRHLSFTRLSGSPPPYLLRVGALFSQAARHLSLLHLQLGGHLSRPVPEQQLARARMVLTRMKTLLSQRGIPLRIVLLPVRRHFEEKDGPTGELHQQILALCRELAIPVQDSWPLFEAAVGSSGIASVFLDQPPGDPHLNAEGHRLMAEFLGH